MLDQIEVLTTKTECGRCSDRYYQAITYLLTSHSPKANAESVYSAAMTYKKTLRKYLDCLETLPKTVEVERDIAQVKECQSQLASDINILLPMIVKKSSGASRHIPMMA